MRRSFSVAVGAVVFFSTMTPAVAAFDQNLGFGISGSGEVRVLQEFLTFQGVYAGPVTGNFLSLTLAGVRAFQEREGIPTTGFFGPLSRARANELIASGPPSDQRTLVDALHSLLTQVWQLQEQLRALEAASIATPPPVEPLTVEPKPALPLPPTPLVEISVVSPLTPTTAGTWSGQAIGAFRVDNYASYPIYLDSVSFTNAGAASPAVSYDLRASQEGYGAGDTSVSYATANATVAFGNITATPEADRRISGGSFRYLTVRTNGTAAQNDTFTIGVARLGDVTYAVKETDLGYNANPSANTTLTDTISFLSVSGFPVAATVTAKN